MTSSNPSTPAPRPLRLLERRGQRARHNDFDYACQYWWGDRRPDPDDSANRDFGGASTSLAERRCLVCRPYTSDEEDTLLRWDAMDDLDGLAPASRTVLDRIRDRIRELRLR